MIKALLIASFIQWRDGKKVGLREEGREEGQRMKSGSEGGREGGRKEERFGEGLRTDE